VTVWTWFEDRWHAGNPPIMGPMDHGAWMASTVFDGARAFEGVTPDLDKHCQRLGASAVGMGLQALHRPEELEELCLEGVAKFEKGTALYIRPMYWAAAGFVDADPETTRFCLAVYESPMPDPKGIAITQSPFRRPSPESAPPRAKAACLYPNSGRALREARQRGFDNAVMLDMVGNVSELATANIWMVKGGVAYTPIPNGTFLNGIPRQRVLQLLRSAGVEAVECSLTYADLAGADELFSTGNYAKVQPVTRIGERNLQPGPVYARARELYWSWSHGAL